MSLFGKKIDDLELADFQRLIAGGITEGQSLEFKRAAWGTADEDVREMLRDISSMANAYGGLICVGIDEDAEGKASVVVPIQNSGDERDRIFGSCLANLQPRIIGLNIREIGGVLVIEVPDSLNLHQITYKGLYQFWVRHDRQKTKMSVDEIREAFLRNASGLERSTELVAQRVERARSLGPPTLLLSAAPLKLEAELFRIDDEPLRGLIRDLPGERYGGWGFNAVQLQVRPSINGLQLGDERLGLRLELFRNGFFEATVTLRERYQYSTLEPDSGADLPIGTHVLHGAAIVEYTQNFLKRLERIVRALGREGAYLVSLDLLNIRGFAIPRRRTGMAVFQEYAISVEPHVEIGPLVYESLDAGLIGKELCDRVWQAFGFEGEPYFRDGAPNFEH